MYSTIARKARRKRRATVVCIALEANNLKRPHARRKGRLRPLPSVVLGAQPAASLPAASQPAPGHLGSGGVGDCGGGGPKRAAAVAPACFKTRKSESSPPVACDRCQNYFVDLDTYFL